jgi:hypothetical protein
MCLKNDTTIAKNGDSRGAEPVGNISDGLTHLVSKVRVLGLGLKGPVDIPASRSFSPEGLGLVLAEASLTHNN